MPDAVKALRHCVGMLKPESGRVYVTQTIQTSHSKLVELGKPLLKFLTTIDFGSVTYEEELLNTFKKAGLTVREHVPISGSSMTSTRSFRLQLGHRHGVRPAMVLQVGATHSNRLGQPQAAATGQTAESGRAGAPQEELQVLVLPERGHGQLFAVGVELAAVGKAHRLDGAERYEGLGKFFAGSAFLSWGRMGNLRGSWVKGPLPQAFIDNQHELQLKILKRMREFGMIPALPAFAGHVPEDLKLTLPNANFTRSPNWGNFTDEYCCVYMIEPTDPLYREIGKAFLKEQRALYNYTSSLYQCDTYMEMAPEFSDLFELKGAARAVIDGMTAADPDAVWLMQGWPFVDDPNYWTRPRVKAYLDGVPTDKLIILDFYSEAVPIWDKMDNYFGKSWIYSVLHNFGGNTGMRGDLPTLGAAPVLAKRAGNGTMVGVGLTMEGIFQNYVVYDLTLQMAWVDSPLDMSEWVPKYAAQRYHTQNEHVERAWNYLSRSVYNRTLAYGGVTKSLVCLIPHWRLQYDRFQPTLIKYDPNDIVLAWKELLLAGDELRDVDTYRHDLVDVTKQYLSNKLLAQYQHLKDIYSSKTVSANELCGWTKTMLITINHLEEILATNEDFLLGNWIADALTLAGDLEVGVDDELTRSKLREYYEYEARNQVTRWGDNNNEAIHDYAGKEWAGLVKGYYLPRWNMWLTEVCSAYTGHREMDEKALKKQRIAFELKWQLSHEPYPTTTVGDSFSISKRLYSEYITTNSVVPWGFFEANVAVM
ncbi:hypothetical protein ON010_g12145 [Phytophthora cinnamomi]|nr:hypothetical protein ON010_g12145 [Phytophthora cinnamomi]